MPTVSFHLNKPLIIPTYPDFRLYAPFAIQSTRDGTFLMLRHSYDTLNNVFLQTFHPSTDSTTFLPLDNYFSVGNITTFYIVNDRTLMICRYWFYILVEFTDESFTVISRVRRLPEDWSQSANKFVDHDSYSKFIRGSFIDDNDVTICYNESADHSIEIVSMNRERIMDDKGTLIGRTADTEKHNWSNGSLISSGPNQFQHISRFSHSDFMIRNIVLDPYTGLLSVQRLFTNSDHLFDKRFEQIEEQFCSFSLQQLNETPTQSVKFADHVLTCHPEGILIHRIFKNQSDPRHNQLFSSNDGRLSAFCVTADRNFVITVIVKTEQKYRMGDFTEEYECHVQAIVDDELSLQKFALRAVLSHLTKEFEEDEDMIDIVYDHPKLIRKMLGIE